MGEDDKEVEAEIAGQKFRAKNYRLIDLIWLPLVLGVAYIALTLYQHEASAQSEKAMIANTLKESNHTIAEALKESNKVTAEAIKQNTQEIRRATSKLTEIACISDPAMKNRQDAREFCKRISRDDR